MKQHKEISINIIKVLLISLSNLCINKHSCWMGCLSQKW